MDESQTKGTIGGLDIEGVENHGGAASRGGKNSGPRGRDLGTAVGRREGIQTRGLGRTTSFQVEGHEAITLGLGVLQTRPNGPGIWRDTSHIYRDASNGRLAWRIA